MSAGEKRLHLNLKSGQDRSFQKLIFPQVASTVRRASPNEPIRWVHLPDFLYTGGEVFPNLLFRTRGDLRIGDNLDRQVWSEGDGDIFIVSDQQPQNCRLDSFVPPARTTHDDEFS